MALTDKEHKTIEAGLLAAVGILAYMLWKKKCPPCGSFTITAEQVPDREPSALHPKGSFTLLPGSSMLFTIDMADKDYVLDNILIDGTDYLTKPSGAYPWGYWTSGEGLFTALFVNVQDNHTLRVHVTVPL